MIQRISRISKLLLFLFVFGFSASSRSQTAGASYLSVKSLMQRMSRREAIERLGGRWVVDSVFTRRPGLAATGKITFAPVILNGFPAILELSIVGDSANRFDAYLPYTPRKHVKPTAPYGQHRFVKATLDDFNRFKQAVATELGDPSVSTETTFEYMIYGGQGSMQPIFAELIKGVIHVQVLPMARPAANEVR